MLNLLSSYLRLGNKLDKLEVFDPILDLDSNYFINIKRLKVTETPEFVGAYEKVNMRFEQIGRLLGVSTKPNDKMYRTAISMFNFPEVNGICLGYSNSKTGSGMGGKLRDQIIGDAKQIIDAGVSDPEIFHLVGLFERGVGPDRLSDMIACIIKEEIVAYTLRINKELQITKKRYPKCEFKDDLLVNPYKGEPLLLLPTDILHELPIARDWEDIDRVCSEIEAIRNEVNVTIGKRWGKLAVGMKKDFMRDLFIKTPNILSEIIERYRIASIDKYDFETDSRGDYLAAKIANSLPEEFPIELKAKDVSSYRVAKSICNKFKDLVENNKVNELLYADGKPRNEKIVQRAFFCVADSYCNAFNIGISAETDSGRGPVDFKFETSYEDRTLVEIKLTSSSNLVHGMETQIQEYAKAEKTRKLIYL
ncbi:hypothetical protein, partial [Paenibacillus alginolyticus]